MSAPERIYLQDAGDYSNAATLEVTWCVEPQHDCDTKYIRADTVAEMIRQAAEQEREACAQVVSVQARPFTEAKTGECQNKQLIESIEAALLSIAAAIRARGDASCG